MTRQTAGSPHVMDWEKVLDSYRPLKIRYAAGEMICQAGSYLAGLHLIVHGAVSDMMPSNNGEPRTCDILSPGDWIGIEVLQGNHAGLSMSLRRALTDVELLFVEKSQFEAALRDDPELLRAILGQAAALYVRTREDPRQLAADASQLGRLLLVLGDACGQSVDAGRVVLPAEISLHTLADLLCFTSRRFRRAKESLAMVDSDDSGITFDPSEVWQWVAGEDVIAA